MTRRTFTLWAGGLLALSLIAPTLAFSQENSEIAKKKPADFPAGPIELTVVYPAGGGMDLIARLLARATEEVSGEKIIVNNRTGGAGMVGHAWLATQAPADGLVMGITSTLLWGDAMLRAKGRWDYTDLEPIAYVNSDVMMWNVLADGPLKDMSLQQVIDVAKAKPNTIRVGTVPGSMWDYLIEQVEANTGAAFLKVPFQSGGAIITAMLGDNVDIAPTFFPEARSYIEAKKLRVLAVASEKEMEQLPGVPTFNEALGSSDYIWTLVRFVVVPKNVPADSKAYLGAAVQAATKSPGMVAEFAKMGVYIDPALRDAPDASEEINKLASRERDFYKRTGRLQ